MTAPRLVNLLDDFALGGVSRGLGIFDSPVIRRVVDPDVVAVSSSALVAPRIDADVIVVHFPPNWRRLAFLASLKLRNPRAVIVHVEHSYTRCWEAAKVTHPWRFRLMLKLALRMVDQVVCVSNAQARWLSEVSGLPVRALEVIYPYSRNPGLDTIALPDFDPARPLRIGAYGRFHEAKGFDRLIEAFKAGAMPGCELVIGGFGALEPDLRALAGDHPGISFAGKIDNVAAFLGQCDVIAVPSNWEAFGQVATEAREAGRPILVSHADGLPEQVGAAGLVIDYSCDAAIAEAFAGLTPERLQAMSAAARDATRLSGAERLRHWARLLARLVRQPAAFMPNEPATA